ncbi:WhiB family transcriptional regulator [Streptomyces sp. SCUT-3]|uniref:WhiB family transcriptional regulator n=2 Tax=unclassified Streptomyces TaxID=2593676 RepID=UPI000CC82294|nr:WhiB family transcriptional regulator [Streptomyces sp. SCUT-3]PLW68031.1 WhiB family transcriptional regulator [Streptomyces sp. DJ]QMV20697.1 WhiB family transcriptional regulator [Streptomyces sp. SCUT-3]
MMNWRDHAACRTEDPELFFPVGSSGSALLQTERAKKVCRSCPAKDPCLEWAMTHSQESGVWGGTDEDERRALKRRAARRSS